MSARKVYQWVEKFQEGRTSIADEYRLGRPCTVVSDANFAYVDILIGENRRISLDSVATMLNISVGSTHGIIRETLRHRYLRSRWVPRQLTDEHKLKRVPSCRAFLTRYHAEGEEFLSCIVTGDETWVHYYEPESKRQSMEWRHASSPAKEKFKSAPYAGKVMVTLFWDMNGPVLEYYQEKGETVNSIRYSAVLEEKLKPAYRSRRR
jgi:histone-lysine N-methyltransferase SETMAR